MPCDNAVGCFMRAKRHLGRSNRQAETRNRAVQVLSRMRRDHLSLAEACRQEHIKPATVHRHVGRAIERDRPGGRYRASKSDRLRRDLQLPTALGPIPVPIRGSKKATQVSKYLNAVSRYLRHGDAGPLKRFQGMKVGPRGQQIELVTDPMTLSSLAHAGALHMDQLYATFVNA